LTPSQVR